MSRKSWDEYFIDMASVVSMRSTCPRLSVGAVLVRDRQVLATGYNGAARGAPHCIDKACLMVDNHCISAVHGETNAILQAAKNGVNTDGATMYITHNPCLKCFQLMYQAGIKRIVHATMYKPVDYGVFRIDNNYMPDIVCLDAQKGQ